MDGCVSQQGLGSEGDSCPGARPAVPVPYPSPGLRAICNHLRKHVQYGSVPAVSAAVKVSTGKVWMRSLVCEPFAFLIHAAAQRHSGKGVPDVGIPELHWDRSGLF